MFDSLFGWRKASDCKKLLKRIQCRLKLLKNKRLAIAMQLREHIAHLLNNGHQLIAFNKLEQLYKDENIASVYELLYHYSEFIILHLSYIRRHKDLPNDINEAISSLIFASTRCGDLPELSLLRKLFGERYGKRFATSALEFHPGNLVSRQVKDKLTRHEISETIKNRMLDEIMRDYFFKTGPLALTYKQEFHAQSPPKGHNKHVKQCVFSPKSSTRGYTHDGKSTNYLEDVKEFKSPTKQDQRFFVFNSPLISKTNTQSHDTKVARKRIRKRSTSMDKSTVNDPHCRNYYSKKNRKDNEIVYSIHKGKHRCSLDRPCYCYTNNDENTPMTVNKRWPPPPPYIRAGKTEIYRSCSLPVAEVVKEVSVGRTVSVSPPHVHPKLPDYDEIEAKFRELKKVHQQQKQV